MGEPNWILLLHRKENQAAGLLFMMRGMHEAMSERIRQADVYM